MSKLCWTLLCAAVLFLSSERLLFAQTSIAQVMHPTPEWEVEYYHQHYFTFAASMTISDLPAPQGFYFAYATPDGKNINAIHHMDLTGSGRGPGFIAASGLDLALGHGFKVTGEGNLLFDRVAHSEGRKNYSMSIWYAGAQAMLRKSLDFRSIYLTAGMSADYYITDIFSGQYVIPGVTYDIQEQLSHYSFNPQQYTALVGVGFLPSHSDERLFSAEFLARIPLSNLFSGQTLADYNSFGVTPVRLWSVSLTLKMELPFGHPISRSDDRPTDGGSSKDSLQQPHYIH